MANGRLAKDVQYLRRHVEAYSNGQAKVTDIDDNLNFLMLEILPNEGFYRGAKIRFRLHFNQDKYPEEVPLVLCLDKVFHPNIDPSDEVDLDEDEVEGSNVCVSLLDEWDSSMGLDHVVMAVLFLMYQPNVEDALSPYFDSESLEEFTEANVRLTLRGGPYEGNTFPRLLVDDDDCAEGVGEKTSEEEKEVSSGMGHSNNLNKDNTADGCPDNATFAGSHPLTDLIIGKASKAELVCNFQNSALTEHNSMLQSVIDENTESDVDGNSAGSKGRPRSLTFGHFLFCNPEVGTLFSNFFHMRGHLQMDRVTSTVVSTEGDVD
ncbi:ubiquitin-conjugating enzyme E2 S-like [Littorina saxatilis]|uniref:UBC core domain-containing protein n=1 Tax=Littorina saxatilis TaxID=31220 RepID=A0AAN9G730_9CAEN